MFDTQLLTPKSRMLLYEKIFLDKENYKGNYRFCFTEKGAFFYQKNKKFYGIGEEIYDDEFPSQPKIQLDKRLTSELVKTYKEFDYSKLKKEYGRPSTEMERWTFYKDAQEEKKIIVWSSERPKVLQNLKKQLDIFILNQKELDKDEE